MPSRPFIELIIQVWIFTIGIFVHREVWPVLFPGEAPPFLVELADEVTSELSGPRDRPTVIWSIFRKDMRTQNETRIAKAETYLRYHHEDNTYTLRTRIVDLRLNILILPLHIPQANSSYQINRDGELQAIDLDAQLRVLGFEGSGRLHGEVRGDQLYRSGEFEAKGFGKAMPDFEPIPAPRGSVLNPTHPVPKLKGLRPGRRWRMPLLNPLGDAVEPVLKAIIEKLQPGQPLNLKLPPSPTHLDAEVLEETETLMYNGQPVECLVISFRGDNQTAKTFVRVSDGAVMRQEATILGDTIILKRE